MKAHTNRLMAACNMGCILLILSLSAVAQAQTRGPSRHTGGNRHPPEKPEIFFYRCPPIGIPPKGWYTHYWSWIHWWEVNAHHDRLPVERDKDAESQDDQPQYGVRPALLKALKEKKNPKVLAEVVYALGRIKCTEATADIIALLKHPNEQVRRNSWLALGLIGDALARATFLKVLDNPTLSEEDSTAWVTGIGLLEKPDPKLLKALVPIITKVNLTLIGDAHHNDAFTPQRMAMWALRMHNHEGINTVAFRILDTSTDPILTDEAIQALGANLNDSLVSDLLNPLYQSRPTGWRTIPCKSMSLAGFEWERSNNGVPGSQEITALRTSVALAYDNLCILRNGMGTRLLHLINRQLGRNYALIQESNVPIEQLTPAQLKNLPTRFFKNDYWRTGDYYLCKGYPPPGPGADTIGYALRYGLIPRGRYGDTELDKDEDPLDARFLCDVLMDRYTSGPTNGHSLNPSRGFAAMALGVYLSRLPNDTTLIRHEKQRKMARYIDRLLTRMATNHHEDPNLRAACVLALGMGQLQQSVEYVVANNNVELVECYGILALGMCRSPWALRAASHVYTNTAEALDLEVIRQGVKRAKGGNVNTLAQIQVLRGLASLGNPQACKMLYPELFKNDYTSREMIRVMKWSGDMSIIDSLAQLLDDSGQQPEVEAFCAWALGEMGDRHAWSIAYQKLMLNRNLTVLPLEANTELVTDKNGGPVHHIQEILQRIHPFLFKELITGPRG